jgi:hypothetical protein
MKKKSIAFLIFIIFTISLYAGDIPKSTAKEVAINFHQQVSGLKTGTVQIAEEIVFEDASVPLFFLFNFDNERGFVIVSSDDKTIPVLGYSDEGSFDPGNMPPALKALIENYKEQIKAIKAKGSAWPANPDWQSALSPSKKKSGGGGMQYDVSPLFGGMKWNQGCNYNHFCPECTSGGSCGYVWAGCVATAMAMAMKYHDWPPQGVGEHTYTHHTYGEQYANFGATTYDWANMPNTLGSATQAQKDEVARFMYHCGVSVNMNYSCSGSGSHVSTATNSAIEYFRYSPNALYTGKGSYTEENWIKLLKRELDNNRPLMYKGSGSGGHAFVFDGYDNSDRFHVNWGWGGSYNGYFYVTDLTPASHDYTNSQYATVGFQPAPDYNGPDSTTVIALTAGVPYNGTTFGKENHVNKYEGCYYHLTGFDEFHTVTTTMPGRISAFLEHVDTIEMAVLVMDKCTREGMVAYHNNKVIYDDAPPGKYYIAVDGKYAHEGDYTLTVNVPTTDPDLIIESPNVNPYMVEPGQPNVKLTATIKNIGNSTSGNCKLRFYYSEDEQLDGGDVLIHGIQVDTLGVKGSVMINETVAMPGAMTPGFTRYVIFSVDDDNEVTESDESMNQEAVNIQVPEPGRMDCSAAYPILDGVPFYGNTATMGDTAIQNYACAFNQNAKKVLHKFTPEFDGMAKVEICESIKGNMYALMMPSCNENTCNFQVAVWNPDSSCSSQQVFVTGGNTYYIAVDADTTSGQPAEGPYRLTVHFPKECPEISLTTFSDTLLCEGDGGAFLSTDWGYDNYTWRKDGVIIPDEDNSSYRATEGGIYTVEVSLNECLAVSNSISVQFSPEPDISAVSPLGDTVFCEGQSVDIQIDTVGVFEYLWYKDNQALELATDTIFTATETGKYKVRITNSSCSKFSVNEVEVLANAMPNNTGDTLNMPLEDIWAWFPFNSWGKDESGASHWSGINGAEETADRFDNPKKAYYFDGTDDYGYAYTKVDNPNHLTLALWFKTTTNQGGKLIGFGDEKYVASTSYDRHIYMDDDGKLHFGVNSGGTQLVSTSDSYNDGKWHFVAATLSSSGMKIYVDMKLKDSRATPTSGQNFEGYWLYGYDALSGWPNAPASDHFKGILDEIWIYERELSVSELEILYEDQLLELIPEEEVICGASGSTSILVINAQENVNYQLRNDADDSPLGSPVAGNLDTIFLPTGLLNATTTFNVWAENDTTGCGYELNGLAEVMVNELVNPSVDIYSDKAGDSICNGEIIVFTAVQQFGGNPTYQWKVNGGNVGNDTAVFVTSSLTNGDKVEVEMTSSLGCVSSATVSSNSIEVKVLPVLAPAITISSNAPGNTIVKGDMITFSSVVSNEGHDEMYNWYINGATTGVDQDTYQSTYLKDGDEVQAKLISGYFCTQPVDAMSNIIPVTVISRPDLLLNTATVNPDVLEANDNVLVSCQVSNQGTEDIAGDVVVCYYLSVNDVFEPATDAFISADTIAGLPKGAAELFDETITIPDTTSVGTRYILFVADRDNDITEIDELNNMAKKQITVNKAPEGGTATPSLIGVCAGNSVEISLAGHYGSIQWEQSPNGTGNWLNVTGGSGATAGVYTTPTLSDTTWYRARLSAPGYSDVYSSKVQVLVSPLPVAGTVDAKYYVCVGGQALLELTGALGSIQWEESTDSLSWSDVSGGSGAQSSYYQTAGLSSNAWYRARVGSQYCSDVYSGIAKVQVVANPIAGTVAISDSLVCLGEEIELQLSGNNGDIQWQQSADTVLNFVNIPGETDLNALVEASVPQYFRALVSINGCLDTAYSDTVFSNVQKTKPGSDFSYHAEDKQVTITNLTANSDSCRWNFGDSTQYTLVNPVHDYADYGNYMVSLKSYYGVCRDSAQKLVVILEPNNVSLPAENLVYLYPNPTSGVIYIKGLRVEDRAAVYSVTGQKIKDLHVKPGNCSFNAAGMPAGVYFLRVSNQNAAIKVYPFVVE